MTLPQISVPTNFLPYQLEMEDVSITADGVSDFLWPISIGAHRPMSDAAAVQLANGLRDLSMKDSITNQAFFILAHHFFIDALALFQSSLVASRFREAKREPKPPNRGRALSAVLNQIAPSPPSIIQHLQNGPEIPRRVRAPLRFCRDILLHDGLTRRRFSKLDFKHDIISVGVDPLIAAHARAINERVTFQRPHLWFKAQKSDRQLILKEEIEHCISIAIATFEAGFAVVEMPRPDFIGDYLRNWFPSAIGLVATHLDNIGKAGTPTPRKLWTGSGGNIWSRILRCAVRRRGGHVWAHDHGSGSGQFLGEWFKNIVEFDTCDTFVSFTPAQVKGLKEHIRSEVLVRKDEPNITCPSETVFSARRPSNLSQRRKPTVMLLSSFYFGDWATHQSFMPDIPFLDWEARCLAHLQEWGLPTLYKPHPLIVTRAPRHMAETFGSQELNQPSEKVLNRADVILLPDPSSTAFATALSSDRPAVFIDFGLFSFRPEARALLEKRCICVPVPLDSENRPQPNWEDLLAAIHGAHRVRATTYADTYYGPLYQK